ncbi:hypothetical protein Ndes2526B_g02987 [Nannochloris sp. 'desiccata']|nr:hypothetical protein KSW81_006765 [Chlorella desiccata (nom. nud.)]
MGADTGGNILISGGDLETQQTALRTFKRRPRSTEPWNPSPTPFAAAATPAVGISLAAQPSTAALEPRTKRHKQSSAPFKPAKQLVQVHLDLGQRNFHSTRCPTCGLIYTPGKESDDRLHATYHNKLAAAPRYSAFSGDTTVATDGTIGDIVRLCTTAQSKSLKDLVAILEPELGLVPGWLLAVPATVFLYVCRKTRNILGCLVAENITEGWKASASSDKEESKHPKITNSSGNGSCRPRSPYGADDTMSALGGGATTNDRKRGIVLVDKEATEKVRHGIRMTWTSSQARRKNIATKLLDCARCQLVRGYVVPRDRLAFSQPTSDGAGFIKAYSNSNEFLVYDAMSST